MDLMDLDLKPGKSFSAKVRSLLRCPVASPSSASGFWLLVAFPRSKIKLSVDSVGKILSSTIGAPDHLLDVSETGEWIFKFKVASRDVGLMIYDLRSHSCASFKLVFYLCNDRGFQQATALLKPEYPWVYAQSKKNRRTYADVARMNHTSNSSVLTGANRIPIHQKPLFSGNLAFNRKNVFSRLNSDDLLRNVPPKNTQDSVSNLKHSNHAPTAKEDIDQAIGGFARLISWEHDMDHPYRLLVKVCVTDLEAVPDFIVLSDGDEFHGQSWSIQCEILNHRFLGAPPGNEDPEPAPHNGQGPPPFHFYGFGQPGNGPPNQWQNNANEQIHQQVPQLGPAFQNPHPNAAPAANANANHQVQDVNVIPVMNNEMHDLNIAPEMPMPEAEADMPEVEVDNEDFIPVPPLNAQDEQDLNELNALLQPEVQLANALNIQINEVLGNIHVNGAVSFQDNTLDHSTENSVNNEAQNVDVNLVLAPPALLPQAQPTPNIEHGSFLPEEINEEQLLPDNEVIENLEFMQMDNIQLGMVRTFHNTTLMFPPKAKALPDTVRLWAKFFDSGNSNSLKSCPEHIIRCTQQLISEVENPAIPPKDIDTSNMKTPRKKRARATPTLRLVEDDTVRRSERVKNRNKGFKSSACADKNCLACSVKPPTFSPSLIKNLGVTFCNMPSQEVSAATLQSKKKTTKKVIKKPTGDKLESSKPRARKLTKVKKAEQLINKDDA
ncbi:unnamed protein product [Urochloa decumbens]|uniref:Uncharacterized protein n=1 Tax=Urochloa decumbens TaxID=240449 RepID=A0ABC9ATD7_9POAL